MDEGENQALDGRREPRGTASEKFYWRPVTATKKPYGTTCYVRHSDFCDGTVEPILYDGSHLESLATAGYNQTMNMETQELLRICESLPEDKRAEVADFARFLLAREDDERWERLIAFDQRRPKLDTFLRESAAEPSAPMDVDRL